MAHFTPCSKTISREGMVHLLLNNVVRMHRLPDDVISDRGPQFVSHFWQRLLQTLGISVKLSSAYHPKLTGKRSVSTKSLSSIFGARLVTNKMIGSTYFRSRNSPTIILSMHRLASIPFLPTMVSNILASTFPFLPLP